VACSSGNLVNEVELEEDDADERRPPPLVTLTVWDVMVDRRVCIWVFVFIFACFVLVASPWYKASVEFYERQER